MVEGKWGGDTGYYLDGSENYVTDLVIDPNAFTLEAWVKPMTGGYGAHQMIASSYGTAAEQTRSMFLNYYSNDQRFYYSVRDASSGWIEETQANNASPPDVWYYIRGVYDGSTYKMYVDDTLIGSSAISNPSMGQEGLTINIGNNYIQSGNRFKGVISDFRY